MVAIFEDGFGVSWAERAWSRVVGVRGINWVSGRAVSLVIAKQEGTLTDLE